MWIKPSAQQAIINPVMKKKLLVLLAFFSAACGRAKTSNIQKDILTFYIFIHPGFDEKAEIVLTRVDTQQTIKFLLLDRDFPNRMRDTFYFKQISLTKGQFRNFDSLVIKKTKRNQPHQWTGCCDGMPVKFQLANGIDTSVLYFRSPVISNPDSSGYYITKAAIDQLAVLSKDSVIIDYFRDIDTYMDDSKHHIKWNENRPINRLRKIEYSR
jgi:hypothetical protein